MKIKKESCSIVLVGNWNKYILSPTWLGKKIFEQEKIQIEFSLELGPPARYTALDVRIIPTNDKVTFIAMNESEETLSRIERYAKNLLNILQYTPIQAFGINFGFSESIEKGSLIDLFKFPDNDQLSDKGVRILTNSIRRELDINGKILNFTISQDGEMVSFDFNYHYGVADATEAIAKLENINSHKESSESLLREVYSLEYDPSENEVTK